MHHILHHTLFLVIMKGFTPVIGQAFKDGIGENGLTIVISQIHKPYCNKSINLTVIFLFFQETEDPSLVPESTETEYAFDNNSTSEGGFRF